MLCIGPSPPSNIKEDVSYSSKNIITQMKNKIKESQLLVKTLIDQSNNTYNKLSISQSKKRMFEHNSNDNMIKQKQDKKVKLINDYVSILVLPRLG
jgi:hypothetical protein